jgi:hypothetical protein
MSDDSRVRSQSAAPPSVSADYDPIHATIVATATGRWFLDEYARRCRSAETDLVLAALERIEQAIAAGQAPAPAERVQADLAALVESIRQMRGDVVERHGDPAASGEAAVAEFRNAVEQVQDLVLAARGGDAASDLSAQISFQTNRLAGAADRLERSMGALRALLGLVDDLDQRLRDLAQLPTQVADAANEPSPAAASGSAASPAEWAQPSADATPPAPDPMLAGLEREEPEAWHAPQGEALWDMPTAPDAPAGEQTAAAEPVSEATVSDWTFAPTDAEPEPDSQPPPMAEPAAAESVLSALERIEVREYGRRVVATAVVPPEPDVVPVHLEVAEMPAEPAEGGGAQYAGGLDDLVIGGPPPPAAAAEPNVALPDVEWTLAPRAPSPAAESMLDADLFDTDNGSAPAPLKADAPADLGSDLSFESAGSGPLERAIEPHREEPAVFMEAVTEAPATEPQPPDAATTAIPRDLPADLQAPWSARSPHPEQAREPESEPRPPAPEGEGETDVPSVRQRLEDMRHAIAALMDEVSEKTARRIPPRQP